MEKYDAPFVKERFLIRCNNANTHKSESRDECMGAPENAEKNIELVKQKIKPVITVLCKHIKITLTIQRSTSIKELLGLKKMDSKAHSPTKIKVCMRNERIGLRVLC